MPLPDNWPPHQFTPNPWETIGPDTVCFALLETLEEGGFSHHTQCGYPHSSHP
jgi:hypothetical protein